MTGSMHKLLMSLGTALAAAMLSTQASALIISLTPSFQTAQPTDSVSIDIVATDFGNEVIGAFDFDILYDSLALSFTGYTLGGGLGDLGLGEALDLSFGDLGGIIDLAETSFLFDFELLPLQSSPLVLATLDFTVDVLAPGDITVVQLDVGDPNLYVAGEFGLELLDVEYNPTAVISNGERDLPTPATLSLFGLGLVGLGMFRRRR